MFLGLCVIFVVIIVFREVFKGAQVDAWALGADEGRCSLRYASGSWQTNCDPRISEWGNPARVMSSYLHLNI